jgi:hypothetical protein
MDIATQGSNPAVLLKDMQWLYTPRAVEMLPECRRKYGQNNKPEDLEIFNESIFTYTQKLQNMIRINK